MEMVRKERRQGRESGERGGKAARVNLGDDVKRTESGGGEKKK